jgi:hypothetical protein
VRPADRSFLAVSVFVVFHHVEAARAD